MPETQPKPKILIKFERNWMIVTAANLAKKITPVLYPDFSGPVYGFGYLKNTENS